MYLFSLELAYQSFVELFAIVQYGSNLNVDWKPSVYYTQSYARVCDKEQNVCFAHKFDWELVET